MSAQPVSRQPSGVPVGGQFAPNQRPGSGLSLQPPPPASRLPVDYEVDDSFPQPQANDLDKVVCVVDAIDRGANTPEAISESLGIHPREGFYYSDAAGYLGMVEPVQGEEIRTFTNTSLGNDIVASSDEDRSATVREMVAHVPSVAIYDAEGDKGVEEFLSLEGLTGSTVERRAATIRSWVGQSADPDALVGSVRQSHAETIYRADAAAERAKEAAEGRRRARQSKEEVQTAPCPSCFMQLPLSGVCDCGHEAAAAA